MLLSVELLLPSHLPNTVVGRNNMYIILGVGSLFSEK